MGLDDKITNGDDTIDVPALNERIKWLETALDLNPHNLIEDELQDCQEELEGLRELAGQAAGGSGRTLINNGYLATYAEDLAEDLHGPTSAWPLSLVNWEEAADSLKVDYQSVDFDGVTYWVHS